MSMIATIACNEYATPCAIARTNGPVMMMAMAFVKSMSTRMKAVGLVYEISYDPIVGFTKPTYPAMLPFMNWLSITSLFLLN